MVRQSDPELEAVVRDLEDFLGEETLEKGRYQLRMEVYRFFIGLILPLVFALLWLPTGWATDLRDALRANNTLGATWLALLIFLFVDALIDFPVSWYFDFRLENRLGTNRQSFSGWLWDEVKQLAPNLLLQSLLFLGLYFIFRQWPHRWLVGMIVLVVAFLAIFYLISPLLLRLQYKSEPLDDPELSERIKSLFERSGLRFGGLAVLKLGEKTSRSNAAVVPSGLGDKVVISDTLLEKNDPEVIEVVVAHELGHKVHKDLLKQLVIIGVVLVFALAVAYWVLQSFGYWDGLDGPSDVATFPLLALTLAWVMMAIQLLFNAVVRKMEVAADEYSLRLTDNPGAFERSMFLLAEDNKSIPLPPRLVEAIFYTHPSLARRVLMARRWKTKTAGADG